MILPSFHESSLGIFALLTMPFVGWSIINEHFDLYNQHFNLDYLVHFDNGLDHLRYGVFVELPMILYEHWCETSVFISDTLDNPFLMGL